MGLNFDRLESNIISKSMDVIIALNRIVCAVTCSHLDESNGGAYCPDYLYIIFRQDCAWIK